MPLSFVSVVIPTRSEPQFLPVAVRSAPEGVGDDVDVFMVQPAIFKQKVFSAGHWTATSVVLLTTSADATDHYLGKIADPRELRVNGPVHTALTLLANFGFNCCFCCRTCMP
jgi:hypothetical protein